MSSKKFIVRAAVLVVLALLLAGCAAPSEKPESENGTSANPEDTLFTLEEVAAFDGKDGREAYVIYDGYVYDVSDHPQWQSGTHGGNMAGTDITDMLENNAPHGISKLEDVIKIGKVIE